MQFIFRNHSLHLFLPQKLQQVVELQRNIKHFSCFLKSTNSLSSSSSGRINLVSAFQLVGEDRITSGYYFTFNKLFGDIKTFFSCRHQGNIRRYSNKMAPILAPTVKLNNGYEMPILGLGTYELKKQTCENAIREALNIGYRHFDTAYLYRNESLIGKILKQRIEDKTILREDIFLTTKLWNTYHEPKMVKYACKVQLDALQLDYIDLYLIHSPVGYKYENDDALKPYEDNVLQTNDIDYVDTYKAMEELVSLGWVRSLGLSNFSIPQMQRILDNCEIVPVTNQVECHPALNQSQLRAFCKNHGILVTAYSPLARPKAPKPLPDFYDSKQLNSIAEKYQKTKAQVVLRYLIDIGTIPIPKSSRPERLLENIDIFNFQLLPEEIAAMEDLNTDTRLWHYEYTKSHQHYPF